MGREAAARHPSHPIPPSRKLPKVASQDARQPESNRNGSSGRARSALSAIEGLHPVLRVPRSTEPHTQWQRFAGSCCSTPTTLAFWQRLPGKTDRCAPCLCRRPCGPGFGLEALVLRRCANRLELGQLGVRFQAKPSPGSRRPLPLLHKLAHSRDPAARGLYKTACELPTP